MRAVFILVLLFLTGCASLMDAQASLLTQARHGLDVARSNGAGSADMHAQLARLRRQRLDDAFDADVRDHEGDLTVGWVIDARIAYAAALDAYAKENAELRASHEVAQRNLQSVDAALERLQFLQSIQNRWLTLPEESK